MKSKGELQITDEDIKRHAPDLIDKRHQMASDLQIVHQAKPQIDQIMQQIADQTGTSMSSRVKDPKAIIRKTVQKRMEQRDYELSDINDLFGARFVYPQGASPEPVIKAIKQAAKQGAFVIIKEEERNKAEYNAWHADIAFPLSDTQSIRGEVQVMDSASAAQAALGHDDHAQYGEDIPDDKTKKLNKQMDKVNQLPPIKQLAIEKTMLEAHKASGDNKLPKNFGQKVIDNI